MATVVGLLVWFIGFLILQQNYAGFDGWTAFWMLVLGFIETLTIGIVHGIQKESRGC